MKHEQINIGNHKIPQGGYDNIVVRAGHLNNLLDDFDAHIPSDGVGKLNTLTEYTSAAGVTIESVLIKDGAVGAPVAYTATVTGLTLGQISAKQQYVVITSTNADYIVSLPLLSSVPTGVMIRGTILNTGCELRVHPTDITATKYINGVTGGNELKLNAGTACYFEAVKRGATKWIVTTVSQLGANTTIVPDK
jgi:hypothetical protein